MKSNIQLFRDLNSSVFGTVQSAPTILDTDLTLLFSSFLSSQETADIFPTFYFLSFSSDAILAQKTSTIWKAFFSFFLPRSQKLSVCCHWGVSGCKSLQISVPSLAERIQTLYWFEYNSRNTVAFGKYQGRLQNPRNTYYNHHIRVSNHHFLSKVLEPFSLLKIYLSIYLKLFVSLSLSLSLSLSIYLSMTLHLSVYLSIYLSVSSHFYLSLFSHNNFLITVTLHVCYPPCIQPIPGHLLNFYF